MHTYIVVGIRTQVLAAKRAPLESIQNTRGGRLDVGDLARRRIDSALDVGELFKHVLLDGIRSRGLRRRRHFLVADSEQIVAGIHRVGESPPLDELSSRSTRCSRAHRASLCDVTCDGAMYASVIARYD